MKFSDFLKDRELLSPEVDQPTPLVSVILPTYQRESEGLLEPCIQSVLKQTFTDFEFIIIDDGSTDKTEAVVQKYCRKDPRIIFVRHKHNCGLPALRTDEGILLARGKYIAFIFDDNSWEPNALSILTRRAESSKADVLFGQMIFKKSEAEKQMLGTLPPAIDLLQNINFIPNGAVMCTRQFFDRYGLYDPHLGIRRVCDWDLWRRAVILGAGFEQVDQIIGREKGRMSPRSLGNKVRMDYKVITAYLMDDARLNERSKALHPDQILDYDVHDPEPFVRYVRDMNEWIAFENAIYKPYFEDHPDLAPVHLLQHNRRYDSRFTGYALNGSYPLFRDRKRFLVIANRVTRIVRDWVSAIAQDPNIILVTSTEMNVSAFNPAELNLVILFDCASKTILPFIHTCQDQGIPVINITEHGFDKPFDGELDPLAKIDLSKHPSLSSQSVEPGYYAQPGAPFPSRKTAALVHSTVDLNIQLGKFEGQWEDTLQLEFIPNTLKPDQEQDQRPLLLAVYLGDPGQLGAGTLTRIIAGLDRVKETLICKVYSLVGDSLPAPLSAFTQSLNYLPTTESLPTLVERNSNTIWIIPAEILNRYSSYHRQIMLEDAVRAGGFIASDELFSKSPVTLAAWIEMTAARYAEVLEQGNGYRHDARYLHYRNILQGVLLRKRIADWNGEERSRDTKSLVLINSQLLGGSEIYGLLLASAFHNLGFDIRVGFPKLDQYGSGSEKIQAWMKEHNLRPAIELDYGTASIAIHSQIFNQDQLQSAAVKLREKIETDNFGLLFCSGFIAESVIAPSEKYLTFMGLFPPWGYALKRMTFTRNRIDGLVSDSQWAVDSWGEWIAPPVACVPSLIENQYFKVLNQNLSAEPVQIAVVGTLIHLKRQKEVLLAVGKLLDEGYNLKLNFYGHQLEIYSTYIQELQAISDQPKYKGRVKFHGFVPDSNEIARKNHLIVSASGDESIPQGLMFNMARGLIPVACPAGGIPEMIIDGQTGFLAQGFTIDDIANALRRSLEQRDNWKEIIVRGRALLVNECSEQIFSNRLLSVMDDGATIRFSEGAAFFRPGVSRLEQDGKKIEKQGGGKAGQILPVSQIIQPGYLVGKQFDIGPDLGRSPLMYALPCQTNHLQGVEFSVGTYLSYPRGKIGIEILSQNRRHVLRKVIISANDLVDNGWHRIEFEPITKAYGLTLPIRITATLQNGHVALYELVEENAPRRNWIQRGLRLARRLLFLPLKRGRRAFFQYGDLTVAKNENGVEPE